ncbi:unnamed protein product [Sphagnum tenellum]
MTGQYKSSDTVVLILSEHGTEEDQQPSSNNAVRRSNSLRKESNISSSRRSLGIFFVAFVLLAAFVLALILASQTDLVFGGGSEGQSKRKLEEEENLIAGHFRLEGFDDRFEEYLGSLSIPKHVIPLIRNSYETVQIWGPRVDAHDEGGGEGGGEGNGNWTMKIKTDYGEHTLNFQLGQKFTISQHADSSSLTEAEQRGWKIQSEMTFTKVGFVEVIRNLNAKDVETKKTFSRVTEDNVESVTKKKVADEDVEEEEEEGGGR